MTTRERTQAVAAAALWLVVVALDAAGIAATRLDWMDELLAFAALVVVPLGLPLVGVAPPRWFAPLTAAPLIALLLPEGPRAGAVMGVWAAACVAVALQRAVPWLRRPTWQPTELAALVTVAYLCVGAGWAVVSRLGWEPFGFAATIVKLTGVHFHYAGFAAMAIATTAARRRATPGVPAAAAVAAGSAVIATGYFTADVLHSVGAVVLTAGLLAVSTITWRTARPLLRLSAVAPLLPMALAIVYALGRVDVGPSMPIDRMAQIHGTLNAFAFSLAGVVGWRATQAERRGGDR